MRKVDYSRRAIVNMIKHLPSVSSVVNSTKTSIKKAKKKNTFPDSTTVVSLAIQNYFPSLYTLRINTCVTIIYIKAELIADFHCQDIENKIQNHLIVRQQGTFCFAQGTEKV